MKMKKIIMFLFVLSLLAGSALAVVYSNEDASFLVASAESITPNPVEPGQDFTVDINVYNHGKGTADGARVQFLDNPVFSLTGKETNFDNPFTICSSCSKSNIYYFTVSPAASSGEYPLIFRIWDSGNTSHEETVYVRVIGQPDVIFDARLLSADVVPDSSFDVSLTIKNVGTGVARNLKLVPSTSGFVMKGSNLLFIDEIRPGEEIRENLTFLTSESVNEGSQALQFAITYKDEKSTAYSLQQSLGLKVLNKVRIDLSSVTFSPTSIKPGMPVEIGVRIENLGEGQADNIQVRLENENLNGLNKAFIGKLDEDEDAPAYFSMNAGNPGKSDLKVIISYEDGLGQHEITQVVPLIVSFPSYGVAAVLGVLFLVLVIGFFLLRNKRKKSDE
jgi:hypothetical protein